ncbi:MAG: penicillin acylase family protein [bacterium]|nr:penicillin acylase family protein [bacterium]
MKKRYKLLIIIILIIIISIPTSYFILKNKFDSSVNPVNGSLNIPGLKNEVLIRRDSLGVPYIEAQNEEDLFMAEGYVMAEDRLWQMVLMTTAMQGRLAEIAGEEVLPVDVLIRSLGTEELITRALSEMDANSLLILEQFSRGVNTYINTHDNLPAEFVLSGLKPEPWRPVDSLYVFGMLSMGVSFNFVEELNFLILANKLGYEKAAWCFPVYPRVHIPFDEAAKLKEIDPKKLAQIAQGLSRIRNKFKDMLPVNSPASNNWALSGKRTKSGKSIIANDTHLSLMIPNPWMIIHLKCPTYEAAGTAIPGIPVITVGFNGSVAWGVTMAMGDNQDIFIEKMKQINGKPHYRYKKEWIPARVQKEVFKIKGKENVTKDIILTRHGPLLNDALLTIPFPPLLPVQPMPIKSEYGLALSWKIQGGGTTFDGFYRLGKVKTIQEAQKAISGIQGIYLNFVFGNSKDIAWQVSGAFPLRKKGKGMFPSPGWNGEYDWKGIVPIEKLPKKINPANGYLATANNKTVDKNYPYHLTNSWYHPDRAERLNEVLGTLKNAARDDMIKLQFEHFSPMAKKIQNLLYNEHVFTKVNNAINSWTDKSRKEKALEAINLLSPKNFDAVMARDSGPAAVLGAFVQALTKEIFLDELGPEDSISWAVFIDTNIMSYPAPEDHLLYRENSPFWDNTATPAKETREDIIAAALAKAIVLCEEKMGTNRKDWSWGSIHTYHWKHEITRATSLLNTYFNRGPFPAGGDNHSLNASTFSWGENFDVFNIPVMRMVVDFGLEEPLFLVSTPGQSGNPSSPHYGDMLPFFLEGKNRNMPFKPEAVKKHYKDVFKLIPGE